ncbi:MAG: hypothetical protein U5R31_00690 [Acidimicrobiia bacterium]|nr:hypothetical protein [Acidimicrobiia bacterium]
MTTGVRYLDLADLLVQAEAILEVDAETLAHRRGPHRLGPRPDQAVKDPRLRSSVLPTIPTTAG